MRRLFTRAAFNPMNLLNFLISGEYTRYLALILAVVTALGLGAGGGSSSSESPRTTTQTTTAKPSPTAPTSTRNPVAEGPFKLVDQPQPNSRRISNDRSVAFAGTAYPNSIHSRGYIAETYAEYNLGNQFSTLKATIGIDDNAKVSDKYGILKFYLDGRLVAEERATFARPRGLSLDVSGATRLRIEFYAFDNTTNKAADSYDVALGSPGLYR